MSILFFPPLANKLKSPTNSLFFFIIILCILQKTMGKETIFIGRSATKSEKILIKLIDYVNPYIQYSRNIQSQPFQCKSIIPNQLPTNIPLAIKCLPIDLDFMQAIELSTDQSIEELSPSTRSQILKADRILDLLKGQCLHYYTSTFIYEYCHKQHIRQFDSEQTKTNNGKSQFQDINMGIFHPQKYNKRKAKVQNNNPTEEQKKTTTPKYSNFSIEYGTLTVQAIDHQYGDLEFEQSQDGNLLFTNSHLVASDAFLLEKPQFMELHCQNQTNGQIFVNYAMIVNPYILIYTSKKGPCTSFIKHRLIPSKNEYFHDNTSQPIRAYGRYIYGNVEQFCSANWVWTRKDNSFPSDGLRQGSLLYLQFFNQQTKKREYSYTIVKRIVTAELLQLQHPIGKSFPIITQYQDLNYSIIWTTRSISRITKCQLLSQQPLNFNQPYDLAYVGNKIVKLSGRAVKQGDKIGCLCKINNYQAVQQIIDIEIRIRQHLWVNYYHSFLTTNTNLLLGQDLMEELLSGCTNYRCFGLQQYNNNKQDQQSSKFTSVIKINSKNKYLPFPQQSSQFYYIINIKENGVIKLITKDQDGTSYTYLLTASQIIKISEWSNRSKSIIKENKIYQNSTFQDALYSNYIYLKVNRLKDGRDMGGIWKYSDNVYLPRFRFREKLVRLQHCEGYAYIRILQLGKMKHGGSLAIVKGMQKIEEHYQDEDSNSVSFLSSSYSINYTYTSGKYCESPLNKYRKTIVTIKCGEAWFQITKVQETSPCEYWIEVESALLCEEGQTYVVERDEDILRRGSDDRISNGGVICHPLQIFDKAPYFILTNTIKV